MNASMPINPNMPQGAMPPSSGMPAPSHQSMPLPQQGGPLLQHPSAPLPQHPSAPLPQQQSAPRPQQQSAPLPANQGQQIPQGAPAQAAPLSDSERMRSSGVLERASFPLAIASLPRDARYAVLDIVFQAMTSDASQVPAPKPANSLIAWIKEMFSTALGPTFSASRVEKLAAPSVVEYERIASNYAAVNLDGDKRALEQYIKSAFCVCLGLPATASVIDTEDAIFARFGMTSGEPLVARLEMLARALPSCFANITPETAAAIQGGQVLTVYGKVRESLRMTTANIADAMPFIAWVLCVHFGMRLHALCDHVPLFNGSGPGEKAPQWQFELPAACCAAVMKAEQNRGEYAQLSERGAELAESRKKHEEELAYYRQVAANYNAMVQQEQNIIRQQYAIEAREDAEAKTYAQQLDIANDDLMRVKRRNAELLRPYEESYDRANSAAQDAKWRRDQADSARQSADSGIDLYEKQLSSAKNEEDTLKDSVSNLEEMLRYSGEDPEVTKAQVESELSDVDHRRVTLQGELKDLQEERDRLDDRASRLRQNNDYEAAHELDHPIHQLDWEIRDKEEELNEIERRRDDLHSQRDDAIRRKRDLDDVQKTLRNDQNRLQAAQQSRKSAERELERRNREQERAEADYSSASSMYSSSQAEADSRKGILDQERLKCQSSEAVEERRVSDLRSTMKRHKDAAQEAQDARLEHQEKLNEMHYIFQNQGMLIPAKANEIRTEAGQMIGIENRMKALAADSAAQRRMFEEHFNAAAGAYMASAQRHRNVLNEHFGKSLLGERMEFLTPQESTMLLGVSLDAFNRLENDLFRRLRSEEFPVYSSCLDVSDYRLSPIEAIQDIFAGNHAALFVVEQMPTLSTGADWVSSASHSGKRMLPSAQTERTRKQRVVLAPNRQTGQPPTLMLSS